MQLLPLSPPPRSYILDTLLRHGLVSDDVATKVRQFIADNQTDKPGVIPAAPPAKPQYKRCDSRGAGGNHAAWCVCGWAACRLRCVRRRACPKTAHTLPFPFLPSSLLVPGCGMRSAQRWLRTRWAASYLS